MGVTNLVGSLGINVNSYLIIDASVDLTDVSSIVVIGQVYLQLIAYLSTVDNNVDLSYTDLITTLMHLDYTVNMEVEIVSLIGNTVRLKGEFKDFDGVLTAVDNVVLKVYDGYKKQVGEDVPLVATEIGKYQYDYVIPNDVVGPLYYEFKGELSGNPILGRAIIDYAWV
jgi:hypothetical protein